MNEDGRLDFDVADSCDGDQVNLDFGSSAANSSKRKGKKSSGHYGSSGGGNDLCRPNQTMRAAMTELRRMLRQPLPPISVTQYEQTTQSLAQRSVRHR